MPNVDVVHNADLANLIPSQKDCSCHREGYYWGPPIPPLPPIPPVPPPPDYPFPPFPPYPYPPCPSTPDDSDVKKNSLEGQICKLSKKAATINKMIDNLDNKKKDIIIKVGDVSFNFGNVDAEIEDWEDGNYADTVRKILVHQRAAIQTEIKKLADELDGE